MIIEFFTGKGTNPFCSGGSNKLIYYSYSVVKVALHDERERACVRSTGKHLPTYVYAFYAAERGFPKNEENLLALALVQYSSI